MSRKITIIESAVGMGGVEFSTLYLASHLDSNRWLTTVICPGEGDLSSACREAGVKVEIIPMPALCSTSIRLGRKDDRLPNPFAWLWNGWAILVATLRLRKFFASEKSDLILTKGIYAHFCGGLAAKWVGLKCIWHVQDFISERFSGLYRNFFGFVAGILPIGLIVDGTAIARQLPSIQSRLSVVLNGLDLQIFRADSNSNVVRRQFLIQPDEVVIGHVARITFWKGQHHLINAFAQIVNKYPRTRLLLVGSSLFDSDVYEKQLRTQIQKLGLVDRIIFAGFRSDLPNVLSAMDVFAYPSVEKDTSPLALLSAMACGLPIVAFDIEGVKEVLGNIGYLVPVGNDAEMAEALTVLIKDKALRKKMGGLVREKATTQFSIEQHVINMEAAFQRFGV